jgi:hypothetical protein
MLVTHERWNAALQFLTQGVLGAHLSPRDARLLSLHLKARPLTAQEAQATLLQIGWYVSCGPLR